MTAGSTRKMMAAIQASVLTAALFVFASGAGAATTLTYQQGVGGYSGTTDTDIWGEGPTQTDGSGLTLSIYDREPSTNNIYRDLIKFDLSSISPSVVIGSATLTLTYSGTPDITSNGYQNSNVINSLYIVDPNPSDVTWTQSTATWNDANNSIPQAWAGGPGLVAGTDYNAIAVAAAPTPNGPSTVANETMTLTISPAGIAAINDWIQNPSDNAGFFMRQPDQSYSIDSFASSENATVAFRPELTLITTPEPASLALLAIGGVTLLRRRRV